MEPTKWRLFVSISFGHCRSPSNALWALAWHFVMFPVFHTRPNKGEISLCIAALKYKFFFYSVFIECNARHCVHRSYARMRDTTPIRTRNQLKIWTKIPNDTPNDDEKNAATTTNKHKITFIHLNAGFLLIRTNKTCSNLLFFCCFLVSLVVSVWFFARRVTIWLIFDVTCVSTSRRSFDPIISVSMKWTQPDRGEKEPEREETHLNKFNLHLIVIRIKPILFVCSIIWILVMRVDCPSTLNVRT